MVTPHAQLERVIRNERGRAFATLVRLVGDFELAEDALQEACVSALTAWPDRGVPDRPHAWLIVAARNHATSALRRRGLWAEKRRVLEQAPPVTADDELPDERLRLIFTCCHPALSLEARVALTLQAVCGLSADVIARLVLDSERAVAQRLVRAKRKIRESGIPYAVPRAEAIDARLEDVLAVVYLLFTEGYRSHKAPDPLRPPLCREAIRLGRLLCALAPGQPEARGLLALMLLHDARRSGRVDSAGELVALEDQDRSCWDRAQIEEGRRELDRALAEGAPGPYQIQAAIAALHAAAPSHPDTDWPQIAGLYAELYERQPSPSIAVSLAVAEGNAFGAARGLERLAELERAGVVSDRIDAARADLLRRGGHTEEALEAYRVALGRARDASEARFLRRRMAGLVTMPNDLRCPHGHEGERSLGARRRKDG